MDDYNPNDFGTPRDDYYIAFVRFGMGFGWDRSTSSTTLYSVVIITMLLLELFDYLPILLGWQLSYALFAIQFAHFRFVSVLQLRLTFHL